MTHSKRLATVVAQILGTVTLAACSGGGTSNQTADTGSPTLDDVACLSVELGATCPGEADASAALVGTETCESPVREVVATGALVSTEDVVATGYGGYLPYTTGSTADTGLGPNTRCCYEAAYIIHEGSGCTIGRPLTVGEHIVSARPVTRGDWVGSPQPAVEHLSAEERATLAAAWRRDALFEHAAIPAFARMALELTALGAPPELLARTAAALTDEVRHAQDCFALASAYAGAPVGPSGLSVSRREDISLERLAVEAFVEGCVGESMAVGRAAAQLHGATDPAVRAVLTRVIADETRHAVLAWDVVRWAIAAGGQPIREAIEREALACAVKHIPAVPGPPGHGVAPQELVQRAAERVLTQVIQPGAAQLLAA